MDIVGRVFGVWLSGAITTMAFEQVRDSAGPADTVNVVSGTINNNSVWFCPLSVVDQKQYGVYSTRSQLGGLSWDGTDPQTG